MTITEFEKAVQLNELIKSISGDIKSLNDFQSQVYNLKTDDGLISITIQGVTITVDQPIGMMVLAGAIESLWVKLHTAKEQFDQLLNPESPYA